LPAKANIFRSSWIFGFLPYIFRNIYKYLKEI
jgi:hypothetical protein